MNVEQKHKRLKTLLKEMRRVLVAFSGGVDSTFLLAMSKEVLGSTNTAAAIESSQVFPSRELALARNLATKLGVKYFIIKNEDLSNKNFSANPPERCYWCKRDLFQKLQDIARKRNFQLVDGTNFDDLKDFRPGIIAAREAGVRHPLAEAKLTKSEIRELSRRMNLPTWNKESSACLASRIPYGLEITSQRLKIIDEGENFLRDLGLREVRLRLHDERTARIEVSPQSLPLVIECRESIVKKLKKLGFLYVTFDLEGYQSGSMNRVLDSD